MKAHPNEAPRITKVAFIETGVLGGKAHARGGHNSAAGPKPSFLQLIGKNTVWWLAVAAATALASVSASLAQDGGSTPIYLDPKRPIEDRIDDLMGRMTLKEKVGQLNLPCVYVEQLGRDIPSKMEACKKFTAGTYTQEIGPACGFFTLANEILHQGARQQAEYFNELQKIALTQTRLKIPVMEDEEGTHGAMFPGGTVFPEGLAVGSSFDLDLVKAIYAAAAAEARAVGIHMLSTLVMEVDCDPRMGRNEEAYTEDPTFICASARPSCGQRRVPTSRPRTRSSPC